MCGIAGYLNLDGRPAERELISRMTSVLAHRGPDGQGVYVKDSLALGHRRLAILDLSPTGEQPMKYAEGRYVITFNGEIYNFLELRAELETLGYTFRSDSDTEVILAAYDCWGEDCQLRFNGMWAFAIWDHQERELFLSRDRFGVKPLHYLLKQNVLAFSSELKSFLTVPAWSVDLDPEMLATAINNFTLIEGQEESILSGVRRLLGGHCLRVRANGEFRLRRWWNTLEHLQSVPQTLAEQAEVFRSIFLEACSLRMRSDVPVGTALSGGLDSASVLCGMSFERRYGADSGRQAKDWQKAFFAYFPHSAQDERHYAEEVIKHTGAEFNVCAIDPLEVVRQLDESLFHFEEIFDHPPTAIWMTYRAMRKAGVVVSLDGHGGDELLSGYHHHLPVAIRDAQSWPHGAEHRLSDLQQIESLMDRRREYPEDPLSPMNRRVEMDFGSCLRIRPRPTVFKNFLADLNILSGFDALARQLYFDFHCVTLPTILRNFDRCSMGSGIEIRAPFMDWRLVTFCFSLPATSKLGQGFTKLILREAMKGILPERVRQRTSKLGFASPFDDWLQGPLKPFLFDCLGSQSFLNSDIWDGPRLRAYVEQSYQQAALGGLRQAWPAIQASRISTIFNRLRQQSQAESQPAATLPAT